MDYEKEIEIDESALDVECLRQSTLMLKWTQYQAEMQKNEDEKKEELDYLKADLDKKIRSDPEAYEITKITEGAILNTIIFDEEYGKVNQEYIDAKFENNVAKGAVRAMAFRKDMLEALIRLHGQQYFAGPNVPRDLSHEATQKGIHKEVTKKISRRLKKQ